MSTELGHAGFRSRPAAPDDPNVCGGCGMTVGSRRLADATPETDPELVEVRERIYADHEAVCRAKRAHAMLHRRLAGPCPDCAHGALAPVPPAVAGSTDTTAD